MNDTRQGHAAADPGDTVEARVIAPLRRARLEPDDLQLARLYVALDAAVQSAAASPARTWRRGRAARWGALGIALAAAAAAVAIVAPPRHHAPFPVASEPARKPLAIAVAGGGLVPADPASGRLVVPAG